METVDQLGSLIQHVSSYLDPSNKFTDFEKISWLQSALKGKRNLIQYLMKKFVMDLDRSKNEHRLSLLLLALITRMVSQLDAASQAVVLSDLTSVEFFWCHVRSLVLSEQVSVSIRSNALSLLVNAFILTKNEWPKLLFSESTIVAVVDLVNRQYAEGSSSQTNRVLLISLEYLLLAYAERPTRVVRSALSNCVVTTMIELGGQLLLGARSMNFFGFDPIVAELDLKQLRFFVNDLIELGGDRVYTPLALLCMESTPPLSPCNQGVDLN